MNDNTEVRDELARLAGWRFVQSTDTAAFPHWVNDDGSPCLDAESEYVHPIPNTLDEASRLPYGYEWFKNQTHGWWVRVPERIPIRWSNTGDEKTDRFALRLAVEKIEHERRNK